jgi:hypothetical protein
LGGAGEAGLPLLLIMGVIVLGLFTVIGIFYSVLVATMVGQRIWQRHYHILAKRMLTKVSVSATVYSLSHSISPIMVVYSCLVSYVQEYVVEDVDGEHTDWCPPPLPAEHISQLRSLGLL